MSTGVDELADGRRVGEHGVGRRDGVDQDFRDQVCARLVDVVEAGLVDQAVDRLAPRQIGLQQAAVQRTDHNIHLCQHFIGKIKRTVGLDFNLRPAQQLEVEAFPAQDFVDAGDFGLLLPQLFFGFLVGAGSPFLGLFGGGRTRR